AYALLFVLVLLFFRPTWLALAHGQLSGFILAVLAWMTFLWSQGKYRQSAWLLPFLFFKPNLGAPLAVVLLLYLFRKDRTSILVSLLSGLFLVLLGMLVNWRWIGEFWTAGETKMLGALGSSPTIWGMATVVCDFQSDCARWLGGGTILLLSLLFLIWFWKRSEHLSPLQVTSLAVCFTLLSTPYTWTYDQILLLVPLTTLTLSLVLQGVRFMKIALLLLGIDLLAFFLALITMGMTYEIPYVTLPLLVTLLLGWSSFRKGKIAGTEEAAA
ncbi:MAG: glycosyltransferase 87 family protein, partial [Anaerolineales bacterium]|nr:glycosyltransferase 87 family protein [Anaerolineales bacterium]